MMQGKSIEEGWIQQGNKKINEKRIHPTQKPVNLYRWIAKKYFHIIGNRTWTFSVATERKIKNGEKYYLCLKYATDTDIRRFTKIQAKANPFDEDWQAYFDKREETTLAL